VFKTGGKSKPFIFSRKAAKFAIRQANGHEPLGLELGAERQRRMAKGMMIKNVYEKSLRLCAFARGFFNYG